MNGERLFEEEGGNDASAVGPLISKEKT